MGWLTNDSTPAERLTRIARDCGENPEAIAGALFGLAGIFDRNLAGDPGFRAAVLEALRSILSRGVRHTLADHAAKPTPDSPAR